MARTAVWWDGEPLGSSALALYVFPLPAAGNERVGQPLLGAAASEAREILIHPQQLGALLTKHASARLIVYNAAQIHWLLDDYLLRANDKDARDFLWDFSRRSRLIDIKLLDYHVSRLLGESSTRSSLNEIVRRWTEQELPEEEDARLTVIAASSKNYGDATWSALHVAEQIVGGMRSAYQLLCNAAHAPLLDALNELERLSRVRPREWEWWAPLESEEPVQEFRLLGIDIDVRGAIALWPSGQDGIRINPEGWDQFRDWNEDRLKEAFETLTADPGAGSCFSERGGIVRLSTNGNPVTDTNRLNGWLRRVAEELVDQNNCPVMYGRGVSSNPRDWGVQALCHKVLRAWRELLRAGRASKLEPTDGRIHPVYEMAPMLASDRPDLSLLESSDLGVCRPREGHLFRLFRVSSGQNIVYQRPIVAHKPGGISPVLSPRPGRA